MSLLRQVDHFWQARILRRKWLLADGLPLGMRFTVPTWDDVGRRLFKYRIHEAPVFEWLQERPAPMQGDLALDVGANLGWYSVLLDRLGAGRLSVHAFEPDPDNRALLLDNLALNECTAVTVSDLALADRAGSATLHRYRAINRGRHSLLPLEGAVGTVEVGQITLDDYLAAAGLAQAPIWLLKLDVEGFEPAVLTGATSGLSRVRFIVMEYSPTIYDRSTAQGLIGRLAEAGFTPSLWEANEWMPVSPEQILALDTQRDTVWERSDA